MKLRTTLALAVAALTIGVQAATAEPGGPYRPQLETTVQPDALDRYLGNNAPTAQPDALGRYLRNAPQPETTGAATHPDSRPARPSLPGDVVASSGDGRDWTTGAVGALGGAFFAILAIVGASAIRERRRLALR